MINLGARDRCFEQCYDVQRSNVCCIISTPFDMSPETQGPDTFTWNVALKMRCCFHRASRWAMIFSVHAHALPESFLEKKKTPKTCQRRTPLNLAGAPIVSWCFLQIAGGGPNSNDRVPVFVCTLKGGNKKRYIVRTGSQCLFVLCCCCCCCLFICLFGWLVCLVCLVCLACLVCLVCLVCLFVCFSPSKLETLRRATATRQKKWNNFVGICSAA